MLRPKAFYFFFFAAMAALLPFLVVYYEQLGFSSQQIGMLSAVNPLLTMMGAPLWGLVADNSGRHKLLLISLMGLSLTAILGITLTQTFGVMLLLVSLFSFFLSPVIALGDTAVLALLGEQKRNYGRLRVWGAYGFGLSAPLVGLTTERFGLDWAFYCYVALMLVCMYSVSGLTVAGRSARLGSSLTGFLTTTWLFFFSTVFLGGAGLAVSGNFVYLRLAELNASGLTVGLALSFATVSEIPITFYSKQLLGRFPVQRLLLAALLFSVLRLFLYSLFNTPLLILLVQLLHGFTFSTMWVAGVAYVNTYAPSDKQATAQGLFGAAMMGLGSATGGLLGGWLYDLVGVNLMFRLLSILLLAGAVILYSQLKRLPATAPLT